MNATLTQNLDRLGFTAVSISIAFPFARPCIDAIKLRNTAHCLLPVAKKKRKEKENEAYRHESTERLRLEKSCRLPDRFLSFGLSQKIA